MAEQKIFFNQNKESAVPVHSDGAQVSTVLNIGSIVPECSVTQASFFTSQRASMVQENQLAAAQPNAANHGQTLAQIKAWSAEEDHILKELMKVHGERKWALIAASLPGRNGKQCRERWINNLRPDIMKEIWTEEEDRILIESHKCYGNRWSAIARCLAGRTENAVKNHWFATKRSLNVKRRFKKKSEQVSPGQYSLLEGYIRSLYPTSEIIVTTTESSLPDLGHGEQACPNTVVPPEFSNFPVGMYMNTTNLSGVAMPPYFEAYKETQVSPAILSSPASYNPHEIRMYINPTNMAGVQAGQPYLNAYGESQVDYYQPTFVNNLNNPLLPEINYEDPQGTYRNLEPLSAENFMWQSSIQGNASGFYDQAGPSSATARATPYDVDVVPVASREFFTQSKDDATLDITKFM